MLMKLTLFCILITIIEVIARSNKTLRQQCDPNILPINCGINQGCEGNANKTYHCNCLQDYVESDGDCVKISTTAAASIDPMNHQTDDKSSSGSSVAAGLLIPTFLIILGGVGFCCAKKYRLLPCRQNAYGNVLVTREEDDDDDPPIA